jgi:hypothetical protein
MLRNLRETEYGLEGEFDFSLFHTETNVFIDMEEPFLDYVNKCIENLNSLSDDIIDKLCEYTILYCEDYREYFEDEEIDIPENIKGREILEYVEPVCLGIEEPDDENSIGYSIELNVAWEEEHGMEWVIRDNKIMYVSSFNNMGAWCDEDDYDDGGNYALGMIKNLKDAGGYYEGDFYSTLFEADMIVALEDNTYIDYAEKCINNFNSLSDSTIKFILGKCIDFFKDMYAEYSDDYDEDCNPEHLTADNVLGDYIEGISINIETPQNNDISAYQIEILCPIDCPVCVIRDNKVIYIGEDTNSSPWDNFDNADSNYAKE